MYVLVSINFVTLHDKCGQWDTLAPEKDIDIKHV